MIKEVKEYTGEELLRIMVDTEREVDEMERRWRCADEAGKIALIAENPTFIDVGEYIRAQDSIVEARRRANEIAGDIIIK